MSTKLLILLVLSILTSSLFSQAEEINWNEVGYSYIKNTIQIPASPNATSFTRYGAFNVSHYTGTANVSIPLFQLGDKALSMPVSLNYAASGIKVDDLPGWVGLGWNISAGGAITRTVVGNPDLQLNYYGSSYGWPSDNNLHYTNELEEEQFLENITLGFAEAQPDIFSFNFNGISGRFIIKKDKSILYENKDFLVTTPLFDPAGDIISFTIKDQNGTTYQFQSSEQTSFYVLNENVNLAQTYYEFNSAWYLTSISHFNPGEGSFILKYKQIPGFQTNVVSPYSLRSKTLPYPQGTMDCCDDNTLDNTATYDDQKISFRRIIDTIIYLQNGSIKQKLVFNSSVWSGNYQDGNYKIDNISLYDMKYHAAFTYKQKGFVFSYSANNDRLSLSQLTEEGKVGSNHPPYNFEYESGNLPAPFLDGVDFWGYANGSSGGLIHGDCNFNHPDFKNRGPSFSNGKRGTLNKIIFPTGGYQRFYYEAHNVETYNIGLSPACNLQTVGGLRIQKIENYIRTSPATNKLEEVREYTYLGGKSLKKIQTIRSGARIHDDIGGNGSCDGTYNCNLRTFLANCFIQINVFEPGHVGYDNVSEITKTNLASPNTTNGKVVYEFLNPPIISYFQVRNGELRSKTVYDNATTPKIKEKTTYSYFLDTQSLTGTIYYGAGTEANPNQHMFYNMYCNIGGDNYDWTYPPYCMANGLEFDSDLDRKKYLYQTKYNFTSEIKTETYSENILVTIPLEKTIKFEYNYALAKVPTKVSIINSDGKEHIIEYVYQAATYTTPVETIRKTGTSTKYSQKITFANFLGNLKPSLIQEKFGTGSYVSAEEILAYTGSGKVREARQFNNVENSYLWWHDERILLGSVQNAKQNEVVYSSFEVPMLEALSSGWITTVSQYVSGGNSGATGNGYYKGGNTLTSSFVPLGKYLLSYYTKSPTLTNITISGAAGTTLSTMYRKISSMYANGWYQVEAMVNITSGGAQGGQVSLAFGSTVFIDELRLYPYDALMQTFTYDYSNNQLISICDPSGKITRYIYDNLDRLTGTLNHDNHFVQTKQYYYPTIGFVHNTIVTRDVLTSGITTESAVHALTGSNVIISYEYFDGLGKPLQQVKLNNSPTGKDIYTYNEFDIYGREIKQFLPFTFNNTNTAIQDVYLNTATTEQANFYNALYPGQGSTAFTETILENSPLNRNKGTRSPGTTAQSYPTSIAYELNSATEVRNPVVASTFYPAQTLFKTIETDEDGKMTTTYSDRMGQKIMEDIGGAKTYFAYSDVGQVTHIIQPEGSKLLHSTISNVASSTPVIKFCFIYTYDAEYRLSTKSIPGISGNYTYQYDQLDRAVITIDPKSFRSFVKYDALGRVILTGKYTGTSTPGLSALFEIRSNTAPNNYTNFAFPTGGAEVYEVFYYDDYNFNFDDSYLDDISYQANPSLGIVYNTPTFTGNHPSSLLHLFTRGLQTGSKTGVLKQDLSVPTSFVTSYPFYDKFGRGIQTITGHAYTGADVDWIKYNFPGWVMASSREHKSNISSTAVNQFLLSTMTYDHAGRPLTSAITIDDLTAVTTSQKTYNELDQMSLNNLGSGIQQVNYAYNIRGWLTAINDVDACSSDAFSMRLNYETGNTSIIPGHTGYQNGNIASVEWRTGVNCSVNGSPRNKAWYAFNYDNKNRLTQASYGEITGSANLNRYTFSGVTYNDNGDILTSQTQGKNGAGYTLIDNLTYSYSGTGSPAKLLSVTDISSTTLGFVTTASNVNAYTYDNNGNITNRTNTAHNTLEYNHLNLPKKFTGTGGTIDNTYDASGRKWQTTQNGIASYYFGDFERGASTRTIYHEDGRIVHNGGSNWEYHYYLKDHIGNLRAVVKGPAGTPILMQEYHFYPFGMGMDGSWVTPTGTTEKYRYNGKELVQNGLNMYDYGARWYEPSVGRWLSIDPSAHLAPGWSPYRYGFNNPISFIDPDGQFESRKDARAYRRENEEHGYIQKQEDGTFAIVSTTYIDGANIETSTQNYGIGIGVATAITIKPNDVISKEIGWFSDAHTLRDGTVSNESHKDIGFPMGGTVAAGMRISSMTGKYTFGQLRKAVMKAYENLNVRSLPKYKNGKYGSAQRGDSKKGIRLDKEGHPNSTNPNEVGPHVNWWDFTKGNWNNGKGPGTKDAIKIE